VARETLALLAWGASYPFGVKHSTKRMPKDPAQRTVVFVHGYLSNRSVFFPLHVYLRSTGIKNILSFNYNSHFGVERAAKQLRDFLKEQVPGGEIDLVCHSMGGIIAQMYIQELGGHRRVKKCINLGTPHKGTYSSYWWVTSRVGRELRPDSSIMERLIASEGKFPSIKYTSIVGGSDNIVIPRVFATKGHDIIHVPEVGHVGLLYSPTVYFEIARRLHDRESKDLRVG